MSRDRLDDLVESVTLYIIHPFLFHGYILPFIIVYAVWLYVWLGCYGLWEFYEGGMVGFSAIGCIQILVCLCCHWSVHVRCFFTCRREKDPCKATVVKVVPTANNGSSELIVLYRDEGDKHVDGVIAWFNFQECKYTWDEDKKTFKSLAFPVDKSLAHYMNWRGHLDEFDILAAERLYHGNVLDMVVPEFGELFKERATAPFFVFQVFCVALWCMDKYWYYSIFTLIMLVLFECTLVQQQLRNMAEIRRMGNKPYSMLVYRSRKWRPITTDRLLPGDLVSVTRSRDDNLVPCDMLLLRGPCIVDESMLTGESVPQMKEPLEAVTGTSDSDTDNRILDIESDDGRLHVLFGGTKIVQHTSPAKGVSMGLRPPDGGCVAYVLRTGFGTAQGRLLRTILFGVKRVTANNLETFGFILFLLVFAIAAAAYVWTRGIEDPKRNRYKLFLECTLILTSVVPPELPIELSLAVNTSLLALAKLGVYCTEPFRIPFAGRVDICCFDKTGTLTSDELVVEGVAGVDKKTPSRVTPLAEAPPECGQVLATCHSLVQLDDGLVGDPLEKATLTAADWTLTRADAVIPKKGRQAPMKILQRHHFSSALRRMCVLAGYTPRDVAGLNTSYVVTVKGAPETLKPMFKNLPPHYDSVYLEMSRRGARVLALGIKHLGELNSQEVRQLTRDDLEQDLDFAGFVVISCPLKPDSKSIIREIVEASHRVVMITGDNALTACHVAKELKFAGKPCGTLILTHSENDEWWWSSVDGTVSFPVDTPPKELSQDYDLCLTGEGMEYLRINKPQLLAALVTYVAVFARFAPKQKEHVIVSLKAAGRTSLMCGDGTNDVGALKHAHVGVAILSTGPAHEPSKHIDQKNKKEKKDEAQSNNVVKPPHRSHQHRTQQTQLRQLLKELEEQEEQERARASQLVRLGDASIASPFTSRLSSIQCVCHIIKQGRCTLVTTLQMFKILALNALILAYTQSVLYLDGIKLRDMQATLQGLLLAACFLFISRSRPLRVLSSQRPLPNIFNLYTISTVLLQFAIHFVSLVYLVQQAKLRTPEDELRRAAELAAATLTDHSDEQDEQFQPNIVNSTVYIISMAMQIATFAINYRGQPYMESLTQNKALLWSIVGSGGAVLALALGLVPDLATHFEIIDFPKDFRIILVQVLFADFFFAYIIDKLCLWLCGEGKLKVH